MKNKTMIIIITIIGLGLVGTVAAITANTYNGSSYLSEEESNTFIEETWGLRSGSSGSIDIGYIIPEINDILIDDYIIARYIYGSSLDRVLLSYREKGIELEINTVIIFMKATYKDDHLQLTQTAFIYVDTEHIGITMIGLNRTALDNEALRQSDFTTIKV